MRGDQLARQWRIIRSIEANPQGLTIEEIVKMESCSRRTIYRDLDALQDAGFPLYTKQVEQKNAWAFVDSYKFKVPPPFSITELMSLYLYGDFVRVFKGTPFYDSLESLFKKVRSTLAPQTTAYLDKIRSVFHVGIKPYKDYGRFREMLNQVSEAALERRRIRIVYSPLKSKEDVRRKVDPYKVWFYQGTMYLIGRCHLRNAMRMFVIDRIKMLTMTKENFEIPEDFDLDKYMQNSFGVMHDTLHTVRVRIEPDWARWVGEKIWHESQQAKKNPDGSLDLTFRVAGLDEIKRWVLGLGPEAVVLEPEALIEAVRESLELTLGRYEPGLETQTTIHPRNDRIRS